MTPQEALSHWDRPGPARPAADAGLINQTFLVGEPPWGVLQWVNPIFQPEVHRDIAAWTERIRSAGLTSPELVPTADGRLWVEDEGGGCWRVQSFIPGTTHHRLGSVARAAAVGGLVGRVHAALDGWTPPRHAPVRRIHDTAARMAELQAALDGADGHPLCGPARDLGDDLLRRWAAWDGPQGLPDRICHGDLKVSNVRFDRTGEDAICLIDLDTVGPMDLPSELGDAWRSWCNPAGEDDPAHVRFDLDLFRASAQAFLRAGPALSDAERAGLAPAVERICLELAARFCADAVRNSYFREDREAFPQVGAHNLHRARAQAALAASAASSRSACERVIAAG